jgi:protein SCO1/2
MRWLLAVTAAVLAGRAAAAADRYPVLGVVLEVDRAAGRFVVSHQDIPGFMDAMVMPFVVRDPKQLDGIAAGTMVDFTLVVEKDDAVADDVRVHHFVSGETQPMNAQRLKLIDTLVGTGPVVKALETGQPVPDFTLVDQDNRPLTFSQLGGKVVALSFMYTKCRLATYCFRLSNNLGVLKKRFGDRLGRDVVLLTITFDPLHDTPEVLTQYARNWKADSRGWRFLTGPEADVRRVCHLFGMNFWPEMGMLTHTMRTVVIDREGKVAANLEGNEFTSQQLGDLVQSVIDRRSVRQAEDVVHEAEPRQRP